MDLYQHYRKEEHAFIDLVLAWKNEVETTYKHKLTDFLNPREQEIIGQLMGSEHDDIQLGIFGGGKYTERKRAIIAPYYEELQEDSYELSLVEATYPEEFVALSHRDVMGAFLGLGVERKKLGDIFIDNGIIQIITDERIVPYVMANLTEIGRAKLAFTAKPLSALHEKKPVWLESVKTVSSLRLDNVLKEIYKLSRKDAAMYIAKKYVKVNFRTVEDAAFRLEEGDLLSLRTKGRSKIVSINGETRKEKIRITTAVLQ